MTGADWHRAVREAPSLADALDAIEAANQSGVDFSALLALQGAAVERERADVARRAALLDRFGNDERREVAE